MLQDVAIDRIYDCLLEMGSGFISVDPRQIERLEYGRNIMMFEFDGAVAPIDQAHKSASMLSLVVGLAAYFRN